MNIAILNNLYEPFERGGAERIARLQFEGFKKINDKVITISLKPFNTLTPKTKEHYYISSIFPNLNKMPKFFRLFWHFWDFINIINYFKIKKILVTENIDTVVTHNMTGMSRLIIPYLAKNYQHVHILHDIAFLHPSGLMYYGFENIIDSLFARLFQKINMLFIRHINFVVSPSWWLLELHQKKEMFKNCESIVLPNPVKTEVVKKNVDKDNKDFVFLYVGIISKAKGVDVLLDAFLELTKSNKKIKLLLVGGQGDFDISRAIKENNLISYFGELKHGLILGKMSNANCLIMPSSCYENSPTVIYEATSQGLTVISSRIGGAKEIIDKFGGLLFETGDSQDLQDQMAYVIKNPNKIKKTIEKGMQISKIYNLDHYILEIKKIINHQENH